MDLSKIVSMLLDAGQRANPLLASIYLFTVFVFVILIFARRISGNERALELLAIVTGSSLGIAIAWFVGAIGADLPRQIAAGGAIAIFVSGYLVAKLDSLVTALAHGLRRPEDKTDLYVKVSMFLCSFAFCLLMTLNLRASLADHPPVAEAPAAAAPVAPAPAPAQPN